MKVLVLLVVILTSNIDFSIAKSDPKFRMEKINFIWGKAQNKVDGKMFEKLQKDLATFDSLYMTAKQDSEHHKSKKSIEEIDNKLEQMLRKYDLEDTIRAFRLKYKYETSKIYAESEDNKSNSVLHSHVFDDARVQKLWDAAKEDDDFSLEELDAFFGALQDHEKKLEYYQNLIKQERERKDNEIHEEGDQEYEDLTKKIKIMNQKLEEAFDILKGQVTELKANPFSNAKVRSLWNKARENKNISPSQLENIKVELRHLEKNIRKVDYHREQLNHAKEMHKYGKEKTNSLHDPEITQWEEEHERLSRKMKKLEHHITAKVSHTEL